MDKKALEVLPMNGRIELYKEQFKSSGLEEKIKAL